jgi:hypothetical protein
MINSKFRAVIFFICAATFAVLAYQQANEHGGKMFFYGIGFAASLTELVKQKVAGKSSQRNASG